MSLAILLALIISIGPISNLLKLFYWLLIGLWSLAMMASWSRASWLAVVLGWLASLVIIWFKNRRISRILLLSFFVLIAWIMLWFWPFKDLGRSRITTQPRLEQKSLIERQDGHRQAWSIIKQRPWLGVGLGNYTGFVSGRAEIIGPAWLYQPVHNSLLLIINETGLLGFIWLLGGLMILFWRAQRKNKLIWPLFLAIVWLLLMDHWWWSLHIGIIYFWLWPAILWQIGRQKINLL
jgi:O-antigen ligase